MSKFFEALEQAEQERARDEQAAGRRRPAPAGPDFPSARYAKTAPEEAPVAKPAEEDFTARKSNWDFSGARGNRGVEDHLVGMLSPASNEAEQYRTLCCALEQARTDSNVCVVGITSPGVGDGKTLTAINVASTLAQTPEHRVLLIDADLRHPSVGGDLGMDSFEAPGLLDAVTNPKLALQDVEKHLPSFNFTVVTAGQSFDASPYESLKSPRLDSLLEEARGRYDYVIVDTPPVLPVPDCRVIARWVEGFLIVVAANQTPRKLLEETLNIIEPNKVLGLVFNRDDLPLSDYYGYSYAYGSDSHTSARGGWSDRLVRRLAPSRASVSLAQK